MPEISNRIDPSRTLFWNITDICRELKCSERFVRSMVSSGDFIKPVKWGRKTLWRSADVVKWSQQISLN